MRRPLVLFLASCTTIPAQTGVRQPWADLLSTTPQGLEFSLQLLDPHLYRRGEVIRAVATSPGPIAEPGQAPPKEFWAFGGLLLDPAASCGSLQSPCWGRLAGGVDGADALPSFSSRRGPVEFLLNTCLPSLPPGNYRAALLARKLTLGGSAAQSSAYRYTDPPRYAVSNAVEFQVTPAPAGWVRRTIADSLSTLRGPEGGSLQAYEARRLAAHRLRFLDDPASWRASLDALPAEQSILLRGLEESRQPQRVCDLMRSSIPLPGQSVPYSYLSLAARICGQKLGRRALPPAVVYEEERPLAAALAGSLPAKQAKLKAEAFATLFQYIRQVRFGDEQGAAPPWTPALRREFIRSFSGLDASQQAYLIELAAASIESPELLPLFESVLDAWKPGNYYEAPQAALLGIYQSDPVRARARIRSELTKPRTWLDISQLDLLPAEAVAPMDDALIEALADAQRPGGWNPQLRMAAIAKYATPRALPRIKAIYESQQDPCQPELVAYFVRADPAFAARVFRSHPWDMQAAAPPCAIRYFEITPRLAMAPVLEEYLVAYLMHSEVPVKQTAARSLGRYGSAAALTPLWDALRYFHEYWKGKSAELIRNGEGLQPELELRNAIARGTNWLATDVDLRLIESLCISGRCLDETRHDLGAWHGPLRIELTGEPGGAVAQYFGLHTVEAVKAKLAQFPSGTHFVLSARGAAAKRVASEIREFALHHGLLVADAPASSPR